MGLTAIAALSGGSGSSLPRQCYLGSKARLSDVYACHFQLESTPEKETESRATQ